MGLSLPWILNFSIPSIILPISLGKEELLSWLTKKNMYNLDLTCSKALFMLAKFTLGIVAQQTVYTLTFKVFILGNLIDEKDQRFL